MSFDIRRCCNYVLLSVVNCVGKLFEPVNVCVVGANNAYDDKFDFTYAVVATCVVFVVVAGVGKL